MPTYAADIDHILVNGTKENSETVGDLVAGNKSYIYGITGGNIYADNGIRDVVNGVNQTITDANIPLFPGKPPFLDEILENMGIDSGILDTVDSVNSAIQDKTVGVSGNLNVDGDTGLALGNYGKPSNVVRYYGAVGGDVAINTGLDGSVSILAQESTATAQESSIIRKGNINNNVNSGSVIGGVGGSTAVALGNVNIDAELKVGILTPLEGHLKLDGKTSTTINGNVETTQEENANVIGWMNGGMAAGIGGTATSTVTGNTIYTLNGTDRADHEGAYDSPSSKDILPQITTALNVMEGSKVNAIGVAGGGTALTTLGGTAESQVNGTTTINLHNATVLGTIGGGIAGSVDATGAAEGLLFPDKQLGNNDGTTGFGIGKKEDGSFGILTGEDEEKAIIKVEGTHANEGGTATSTTGDTHVNITGDSTVIGAIGGGIAAASQTYTVRPENEGGAIPEGKNVNDAWGASNATAITGRSHITVDLPDSQLKSGDGWSEISSAVGGFVSGIKNNTTQPDSLAALDGKGGVFGIFGGGVAVGQGSLRGALSEGNGATAIANTAGSDINLKQGYAAAVFGGGGAVAINNARAEANMTDDVNIVTGSDMTTVGIFGGGTAISMEGEAGTDGYKAVASETLAQSNVQTVNIVNNGDTDGIFGGGMAIGNSLRNGGTEGVDDAVTHVDTANITVNGGTVSNLDMNAFMKALKNDNENGWAQWSVLGFNASGAMVDARGIMNETSIAAGGLGMGMSGKDEVETANITVNGGTIEKDILGGGIAVDNLGKKGGAHVGTSIITLNGVPEDDENRVKGSVYAGGAVNGTTPTLISNDPAYKDSKDGTGYDASRTSSTVDTATVILNGMTVDGEISGQGYKLTTKYKNGNYNPYDEGNQVKYTKDSDGDDVNDVYESVGDSTLVLKGTNVLSPLDNTKKDLYTSDNKIHDFNTVTVEANSITKLDKSFTTDSAALIDGGGDGLVQVDSSAMLDLSALTPDTVKSYQIAENTADGSTFWKKVNWQYDRFHYFVTAEGETNGFAVKYEELNENNKDVASQEFTNYLGANEIKPLIDSGFDMGWDNVNDGAYEYFQDWNKNKPAMNAAFGRGMMIGEDSAVTGNTVSVARDVADEVAQHLSFTEDFVQDHDSIYGDDNIWAKYIHNKFETDGMSSSFGGITADNDYNGVIVGYDFNQSGKLQSGVAIHYGHGDGTGSFTRNDYDAWGVSLYGALKDEEAGTNLMADIGYTKTSNDITGTIAGKDLTADRDLTAWTIGVRGEKEFVSGRNQIVPYVGLRYMNVDPSSYTSYYNGKKAFEYDADKQDIWMVPLGVSFRNETKTGSGWRITPKLDVAYIWAFGDTDNEVDVNMAGASAPLYYTVMDDGSWLASLGIDASHGAWTFGAGYAYQKGDDTKNNKWYVNAGFAF